MKVIVIIIFFTANLISPLLAQMSVLKIDSIVFDTTLYNQYDVKNKKTGVWICNSDNLYTVSLYIDGEKDGPELIYLKENEKFRLWYIDNYSKGKLKKWVWFSDQERYYIVDSIRINNNLIKEQKFWIDLDTLYESYVRYYEKGKLKEEGWTIYPESMELDSEDVGIWKVYDDKGNVYLEERGKKVLPNFRK